MMRGEYVPQVCIAMTYLHQWFVQDSKDGHHVFCTIVRAMMYVYTHQDT